MSIDKTIGEVIAEAREQKNLSQRQLAKLAGINSSGLSKIEAGERDPSPKILRKISKHIDVNYNDLMYKMGLGIEVSPLNPFIKDYYSNLKGNELNEAEVNVLGNKQNLEKLVSSCEEKLKDIPEDIKDEFEKAISLNVIDHHWTEHINTLSHLREGIYLRGYGQEDPLRAYTMEGFDLFDKMMQRIDNDITLMLVRSEIRQNIERKEVSKKQITNDSDETIKKQPKKSEKIGRNDPCPCGSGKKYKQCCGK